MQGMENMEVFYCAHNTQSVLEAPSIVFVFYADVAHNQLLPQYYHMASKTQRCIVSKRHIYLVI